MCLPSSFDSVKILARTKRKKSVLELNLEGLRIGIAEIGKPIY